MFPVMSDESVALLSHHRSNRSYSSSSASSAYPSSSSSPRDVRVDVDDRRHHSAIPSDFQLADREATMSPLPPLPPPSPPPSSSFSHRSSSGCGCCTTCCIGVSGVLGNPTFIFLTVTLYFLLHFSVCLYALVVYWEEQCFYEYHYLLFVWMFRDVLGIRILHWQTHAEATEPSTFDRFLKNWMDMIVFIYAGMWALAPRDCMDKAPHHFWLCTVLVCVSYASLIVRGLLYLAMQNLRASMGDCLFIGVRGLSKWLNGGAAFTGPLLREVDVLVMSEMEGVRVTRFERGMWEDEDSLCIVCLDAYQVGGRDPGAGLRSSRSLPVYGRLGDDQAEVLRL